MISLDTPIVVKAELGKCIVDIAGLAICSRKANKQTEFLFLSL